MRGLLYILLGMFIADNFVVLCDIFTSYTPIISEYVVTYVPVVYTSMTDLLF